MNPDNKNINSHISKKGRGPGKKPALVCTSLRLSREVMEFYSKFENQQAKMREVLTDYATSEQLLKKLGLKLVEVDESEE